MTNITNIDRTPYVPPPEHDDPCDVWLNVPQPENRDEQPDIIIHVDRPQSSALEGVAIVLSWIILGLAFGVALAL